MSAELEVHRLELIFVTAPETSTTATLSGADLHVEPGRRQASLGASIDERTFDLQEVGAVPGSEREYLEEHQDLSGAASDDGKSESVSSISDYAGRVLDVAITADLDEDMAGHEKDFVEPTLAAGAPSEDSTILDEEESSDAISREESKEDLSTEIEKAVHQSMVKSIRNTAVLSTQSKRMTMQSMNRIRNSLFNMEPYSDEGKDYDISELINFDES